MGLLGRWEEREEREERCLVVDKITTALRTKIGSRVGRLDDEDAVRLNRALVDFLGLAAGTLSA